MARPSRVRILAASLTVVIGLFALAPAALADDVLVFAAASLKNALDDTVAAYEKSGGGAIKISYAASSALAKQIESGAPADIFVSADLDWMNDVQKNNAIKPETRANFFGNVLVLVEPADNAKTVDIKPGFPLAAMIGDGRLAMANPDSVPAGKYGKAALQKLGVWDWSRRRSRAPKTSVPRCSSSHARKRRSASSIRPTRRPIKA